MHFARVCRKIKLMRKLEISNNIFKTVANFYFYAILILILAYLRML